MTSEIQNNIFSAFDVIVQKRIEELALDKTVIASIEQLVKPEENCYKVQYKGGFMYAYAQSDEVYPPHTSVYVSIPQNDFSNKKWIVGKVSATSEDKMITEVTTALEDFQIVGNNTIGLMNEDNNEFGLHSWKGADLLTLYSREKPGKNVLTINDADLQTYINKAKALLIEATFRTDLDSIQKKREAAEYGLTFNLVFTEGDKTYPTMQDKFDALSEGIAVVVKGEFEDDGQTPKSISLKDCDEKIKELVSRWEDKEFVPTEEDYKNVTTVFEVQKAFVTSMQSQFSDAENELLFQYLKLLEQMITYYENNGDWVAEYHNWFTQSTSTLIKKELSYTLDTSDMIGNPLLFRIPAEQYSIYPIDTGKFQYVDSIQFYCKGFQSNSDWETTPADIFVSEIEFYGLEELSSANGDYRLKLSFPNGQIFAKPTVDDDGNVIQPKNIKIKADMSYQNVGLVGEKYYWFKKDPLVKDAADDNYHYLGGVGWHYFEREDSTEPEFIVSAEKNTAYENIYKCISVHESMILKSEFTIYNDANRRTIEIELNYLSNKFKFDAGVPKMTCKILEPEMTEEEPISVPEKYGENYYKYLWVRKNQQGQIYTLDKTYEELCEEYENGDFDTKLYLKSLMNEMKDTIVDKNVLEYSTKNIAADSSAVFECHVYKYDNAEFENGVYLGFADITLRNEASAEINGYYIVIENGDQVFQYTEAGASPCIEGAAEPLVTKNLICHLFDPQGSEVNSNHYTVRWQYPLTNSLLIPPTEGLKENPGSGLLQWYAEQTAPVVIADVYDYNALDNQIKCIVVYDTITYVKDTEFYFGKIGDNGTNGTDVVAKIEPWVEGSILDDQPLTLIIEDRVAKWNSGLVFNEATTPLELRLYRRGQYIDSGEYKNVKWTMAGGATKSSRFAASASDAAPHLAHIFSGTGKYSNYIVKGEAKLTKVDGSNETQTHYAFYPLPVIEYEKGMSIYNISINKDKTLKHILYNADGRNPLYNENQGVFFNFSEDPQMNFSVSWEAIGGLNERENIPAFDLYYDKDIAEAEDGYYYTAGTLCRTLGKCPYVYIKPKDVYAGAAQNNLVKATIYSNAIVYDGSETSRKTTIKIATVYVPIYMSLNLYGLASLNAWDGNTIEINEEKNYIMAPQIGAGVKNEDNTFTGVVMGKATTYDMEEEQVGLLGYSGGRQSIFLDAKTGSAIFGLTEVDDRQAKEDQKENYTEGRIELIPGGTSRIAGWNIGSRNLYNITGLESNNHAEDGLLKDEKNQIVGYNDDYSKRHMIDIDHHREGIMLSAEPAYISIKGRPLTEEDVSEESDKSVEVDESLELQLDPAQRSLFTVFAHKKKLDENENPVLDENGNQVWYREFLSGINDKGQLIANTVQNGAGTGTGGSGFGVGVLGAFEDINTRSYMGATFSAGTNVESLRTFLRIFCPTDTVEEPESPVYIDGNRWDRGLGRRNEYVKPISLHGSSLALYTTDEQDERTWKETSSRIVINPTLGFVGHYDTIGNGEEHQILSTGSFLALNKEKTSELHSKYHFNTYIGRAQDKNDEDKWPWLFNSFETPKDGSNRADKITRLSLGSIENYVFSNETDILENDSAGHILNYATGSLQLNKAAQDDDNKAIIDKALQINDKNILFGNVDSFKATQNRDAWASTDSSYTIGSTALLASNIEKGFQFKADDKGTTLLTMPRFGLYGQDGIDIKEIGGRGLSIGSKIDTKESYLLFTPKANYSLILSGANNSGYLRFSDKTKEDALYVNGYARVRDIKLSNFEWGPTWDSTYLENNGTSTDGYLTYILYNIWQRVSTIEGNYLSKTDAENTYSKLGHNHAGVYSPVGHGHTGYASSTHTHLTNSVVTGVSTQEHTINGITVYGVKSVTKESVGTGGPR